MILPPLIYYRTAGPDTLESLGCSVLGFVGTLCFSVRYNAMLVLSLDRFNAVFFPFWYTLIHLFLLRSNVGGGGGLGAGFF